MERTKDINVIDSNIQSLYQKLDQLKGGLSTEYSNMVLEGKSPEEIEAHVIEHYKNYASNYNNINASLNDQKGIRREAILSGPNQEEIKAPFSKRAASMLTGLTMSVIMLLQACGHNNSLSGKDEIQDLKEVVEEILIEGYGKGLYDEPVIADGKVLYDEIEEDTLETLYYQLLIRGIAGDALALLNQKGDMTTQETMNGALQFEHDLLHQSLRSTDETIDYSKIYVNADDIKLVDRANDIVNRMNKAVLNDNYGDFSLPAGENDPESLAALTDEAIELKNEMIAKIPDNPTLASDFVITLILRMQDYINLSGKDIINLSEERIFDQPIAVCMERIYASAESFEEFQKIAKDMGIENVDSMATKEEIIQAIQRKYGTADNFKSYTTIIRNQYYGAVFGERLDNTIKIIANREFSEQDIEYSLKNVVKQIVKDIAKLIETGKLNQNIFDREFFINLSKVGINAPELIITENGVMTQSGAYIIYSTKKEKVSPDQVPESAKIGSTHIHTGRPISDDKAETTYNEEAYKAAKAAAAGKSYTAPTNYSDTEKERLKEQYDSVQEQKKTIPTSTPKIEQQDVPNGKEEIIDIKTEGGEAINGNASSPSDTYNGVPNTDLTLNSTEALVPIDYYSNGPVKKLKR